MTDKEQAKIIQQLIKENKKLKKAGGLLAERAIYTVHEFDGLHRLSLAVANWSLTVANEFGRKHEK